MRMREAMTAWTPNREPWAEDEKTRGSVKIGPLLNGGSDWTEPYSFTGGAAYTRQRDAGALEGALWALIEFHTMVVRDKIDPQTAHEAFLAIDDYRWIISEDIKGAEEQPPEIAAEIDAGVAALRNATKITPAK